MEQPGFNEADLETDQTPLKQIKPSINKEKAANVPGMVDLWKSIEGFEELYNSMKVGTKEKYLLKHHLIQLRNQQYVLMDSVYPTTFAKKNKFNFYPWKTDLELNYPVLPRGLMGQGNKEEFCSPRSRKEQASILLTDEEIQELEERRKPFIDFRKKLHLYFLFLSYYDIAAQVLDEPDSPLGDLLNTLDFYVGQAHLTKQQAFILEKKKEGLGNKEIAAVLKEEMGIRHQENYISTIWGKAIDKIQAAVELNYDEFLCRNYDKAWKTCPQCGKEFLRDSRNFIKKKRAADGLSTKCKFCERLNRKRGDVNGEEID